MVLSRRKYSVLTRFYRETIHNPRISHRVRMQAAARLDDLLARHEQAVQQAEARKGRAELRSLAEQSRLAPVEAEQGHRRWAP